MMTAVLSRSMCKPLNPHPWPGGDPRNPVIAAGQAPRPSQTANSPMMPSKCMGGGAPRGRNTVTAEPATLPSAHRPLLVNTHDWETHTAPRPSALGAEPPVPTLPSLQG